MAKTSIKHNAIAWLSQWGTGEISFVPLGQSSSFDVNYDRVSHKGIGSREQVGFYRYKDDNVNFQLSVIASNERTFGTSLSRNNFATENYISGEITSFDLSGCFSALYDLSRTGIYDNLNFYSIYDDLSEADLILSTQYSGFYAKFEDCIMENWNFSAKVGELVQVNTNYSATDIFLKRDSFEFSSGINGNYEAVRPSDILITIGNSTGILFNKTDFNINSIDIELPIQYKKVESFGSSKPSARKLMLPAMGSIKIDGLPSSFNDFLTGALDIQDDTFDISVLVRSKTLKTTGEGDYCAIRFPKAYLQTQSIDSTVGSRMNGSINFSFFECGQEFFTGCNGMFFIRKIPDVVEYYAE